MSKISIKAHDAVAVLRLSNGVTNAISPELVNDVAQAVKRIKSEFKGMVLAGGDKFFCIGLDLPTLVQMGRPEMTEFYFRFNQVVLDLYTLPIPTACAIDGHATAGGAIIALSSDFRFASPGRKFIGFNEVKIGVPVPYLADLILRQVVGDRCATEMIYTGEFLEPEVAKNVDLVDTVCPSEDLEKEAIHKISELAALPQEGIAVVKNNRIEAVRSKYEAMRPSEADLFLECWFSPATQELLKEAVKKF